jgi:hypothetical protein
MELRTNTIRRRTLLKGTAAAVAFAGLSMADTALLTKPPGPSIEDLSFEEKVCSLAILKTTKLRTTKAEASQHLEEMRHALVPEFRLRFFKAMAKVVPVEDVEAATEIVVNNLKDHKPAFRGTIAETLESISTLSPSEQREYVQAVIRQTQDVVRMRNHIRCDAKRVIDIYKKLDVRTKFLFMLACELAWLDGVNISEFSDYFYRSLPDSVTKVQLRQLASEDSETAYLMDVYTRAYAVVREGE